MYKVKNVMLNKPFIEKPVDADNHDVRVYYRGGGVRALFRKDGNSSSMYMSNGTANMCV